MVNAFIDKTREIFCARQLLIQLLDQQDKWRQRMDKTFINKKTTTFIIVRGKKSIPCKDRILLDQQVLRFFEWQIRSNSIPAPLAPIRRQRSPRWRVREKPWMRGFDPRGGWPSRPGYVKLRSLISTHTELASMAFCLNCQQLKNKSSMAKTTQLYIVS